MSHTTQTGLIGRPIVRDLCLPRKYTSVSLSGRNLRWLVYNKYRHAPLTRGWPILA